MDLHVTLAAGPGVSLPGGAATEELVITRAHLATGEQLHQQFTERAGVEHFFVGEKPLSVLQPGVPPFTSGAVIVASTAPLEARSSSRPGNLFFLVRSGPDAGKVVSLSRGTYTIGRGSADITIQDPELSRVHAVLSVTNNSLTLRDRRSANGVWVNGEQIAETVVSTDSDIVMGRSRCALILNDAPNEPASAVDVSEPCEVSAPPPPEGQRLLILTSLLPLVLGIGLAVATGMWFFLAFSALSAVTGLVPLVNGRRKTRAFGAAVAAAVAADSARRRCAAPDVGLLAAAALQPLVHPSIQPSHSSSAGLYLRLGTADQPANIALGSKAPGWRSPCLKGMPVLLPLTEPNGGKPLHLLVRGPGETVLRVAHLLLLQLATAREAEEILCFGSISQLPAAARFLPGVTLVAHPDRLIELLATGRYSSLVLLDADPVVSTPGLRILHFVSSTGSKDGPWTADYFSAEPKLSSPAGSLTFEPDYMHGETFEGLARAVAARGGRTTVSPADGSIPAAVTLKDLITTDDASIAARWCEPWDGTHLGAPVGSSASAPVNLDLVADGPHLLVAGTTGSGKSEFLRTMVLGLAMKYSPANLNFLFIDFKGGSGLGALASLPHVTGILTDLSPADVSRALVSLTAEVKRRERAFAETGASDYREHRGESAEQLPRLVIVIDEFRILSEEVPGSVHELMRIAVLGRSLGMHLLLATQRPQGAITSEIRANITASVALRMQSAMESQDVLDSPVAGSLPIGSPGRGYLRVASAPPVEFQTATTDAGPSWPSASILTFTAAMSAGPSVVAGNPVAVPKALAGKDGLRVIVRTAVDVARSLPLPALRQPVLPPLPAMVVLPQTLPPDVLQLGLLDIPEKQEQRSLAWNPARHAHLAFLGQGSGGLEVVVPAVTAEHLRALPDRHLYLLDATSALRSFRHAPQVGAYVTPSEVKRAARVLQRIAELVADRLGEVGTSVEESSITVVVTGWGRWAAAFRSGRFAWAEDALQDIARDGEACGITLIIAGERELIASRFFTLLPNRLYLPFDASPESLLSWPKLPPMDAVPGRAFVQGRLSTDIGSVAQLLTASAVGPSTSPTRPPFKVSTLPSSVSSASLRSSATARPRVVHVPIGVGGDDLATVHIDLPQRAVALLVGAAGTGKSQALDLIAQTAPRSVRCSRPAAGEDPEAYWQRASKVAGPEDLLLIDDADQLSRETHHTLAAMVSTGARAVFAGSPSPALGTSPALARLRVNPLGVILGPRAQTDGEIFGLRVDVDGKAPPGRGILVNSRGSTEIQIALCT